jgi:hypothetical protein
LDVLVESADPEVVGEDDVDVVIVASEVVDVVAVNSTVTFEMGDVVVPVYVPAMVSVTDSYK